MPDRRGELRINIGIGLYNDGRSWALLRPAEGAFVPKHNMNPSCLNAADQLYRPRELALDCPYLRHFLHEGSHAEGAHFIENFIANRASAWQSSLSLWIGVQKEPRYGGDRRLKGTPISMV